MGWAAFNGEGFLTNFGIFLIIPSLERGDGGVGGNVMMIEQELLLLLPLFGGSCGRWGFAMTTVVLDGEFEFTDEAVAAFFDP